MLVGDEVVDDVLVDDEDEKPDEEDIVVKTWPVVDVEEKDVVDDE